MISIRFLSEPTGPLPRGGASDIVAVDVVAITRSLTSAARRLVADHVANLDLAGPAVVDQQVEMTDHLGEGQEGLPDGDVAPKLLRKLVSGARPLGYESVDLLGAAPVKLEPLVDQRDVVGDRLA